MPRRSSTFAAGVVLAALCLFAFAALAGSAQADGGDLAEVRIVARVGNDGRVEFGLRTRNPDGSWGDPMLPRVRRFPVNATVDRWLYSSAVKVPASVESDLSVRVVDGSFVVRADGLSYEDVCGFVSLQRRSRIVSLTTEHPPACDEFASPVTVLSVADFRPAFDSVDPQQHLVYDWEAHLDRIALPAHLQSDISLADARAVVRAVYADHFRGRERPPSVRLVRPGALGPAAGRYSSPEHLIEITTDGLNSATVLHEVGHALVQSAGVQTGHGPPFTAQMVALWQRYLPNFDATAARSAAVDHGVAVDSQPPSIATGGFLQLNAVQAALGVPDDSTLAAGVPLGLRGVVESENDIVIRIAARLLEDGKIEFAVQPRRASSEWGGRLYPSIRFLPADPPRGRWLNSSPILVAPEAAAASVRVRDDAFVFRVGGQDLTDPCGNVTLLRGNRAVWFSSLDHETCSEWTQWSPVLFTDDTSLAGAQQDAIWHQVSDWLRQLQLDGVTPEVLHTAVTLEEASALGDAIFADHFGGRISNPVRFFRAADGTHYEYRVHGWRSSATWESGPTVWMVLAVLTQALLDVDGGAAYIERRDRYRPPYIAQLITLWERYLSNFDGAAARQAARIHSLRYAAETPLPATGSLFDRAVVRTLLGVR